MSDLEELVDATVAAAFAEAGAVQAARAFREGPRAAYRGSPTDLKVCRHEAAHCVVNWIVGDAPLVEVVVRDDGSGETTNEASARAAEAPPGEDHAGRLAALRADPTAQRILAATCAKHVAMILAGVTADHRAGYADWTSSFDDLAQADRLAEIAVGRANRDRWLVPIRAATQMAVHDSWPLILELADWLAVERRLSGPAVTDWIAAQPGVTGLRSYYSAIFADESGRKSDAQIHAFEDSWHWGPTPEAHLAYLKNSTLHQGKVPVGAGR